MLGQWRAATVEPEEGRPDPESWTPVAVPGRPSALAGGEAVAYRVEFDDPRGADDDRALLILAGLYAHARVWLNGSFVGAHDSYLRPLRHAFEPAARNRLVVECRPPEDRFGGVHDTPLVPDVDAVPGIWWDARVEPQPATFLSALRASPRITDDGAAIDVEAVVEAGTDLDDRLTFSLRPDGDFRSRGMMDRAGVEAAADERVTVTHTIDVRDPALWWPRGHGPQHRYSVRAKLDGATRQVTAGLCSVSHDADGLVVNGERIPVRGVALLDAGVDDVDRAIDANATLVRLHAHGAAPPVYDACDEAGLLVWQDLPLTGPGPFDIDRGTTVAADMAAAVDAHPSVVAYAVHDDPVEPFPDPLGSGTLDRLRLRWRTWRTDHDATDARTVAEALPDSTPAFPVVGPVGIGADAPTVYPGWDYLTAADTTWVLDTFGVDAVAAEFGAGALGTTDPDATEGFDRARHDAHVDGTVERSQAYQATVLKRVAETLRRRGVGVPVAFALRDAGGAGPGVLEADGTEKRGYRALSASYEPVQATLTDPSPGAGSGLVVVNDTDDAVEGTVEWAAGEAGGDASVAVGAGDSERVARVSVPADAETVTLSLAFGDRAVRNVYYL